MIVFAYGARKPTTGFDVLLDQLRLGHRYRNALIEIEVTRLAALHIAGLLGDDWRDEVKALRSKEVRALRAASGLGWGTYQLVEQDVQRAVRSRSPRFRRYDGTGRVGAAVQACSNLSSSKLTAGAVQLSARSGLAICRLRLTGSKYVELPVKLHRELPVAQIVRATVTVNRIGTRWVYAVQFTLRADAPTKVRGIGRVAVNFGWRRVDGGVRVAYAVGDDDCEHELVLPDRIIGRLRHAESLRSLGDDMAHRVLGDARRRSRARAAALNSRPLDARRQAWGKEPLAEQPRREHWARRDRHLYQWECDERASALRARREIYRLWARRLAAFYAEVVVEDFDLRRVALRESEVEIPESRHVRFLAAPSSLRAEIKAVFGSACKLARAVYMTATCAECGADARFDAARELVHRCERCGATWDQDANNARNQLQSVAAE